MKAITTLIYILAIQISFAQTPVFTSLRLGDLKLNTPLDSVNKILKSKIKFTYKKDGYYQSDSANVIYNGLPIKLFFTNYFDESAKKQRIYLTSIYCDHNLLQTKSGIKLGDNKFEIIKKLDGNELRISRDYRDEIKEKNKALSIVTLADYNNNSELIFYFKDHLLYAISIIYIEGGC
jgi:hypothetical protein